MLTRIAYQTEYGIFDHSDPLLSKMRPLALDAMHPKEDYVEGGQVFSYIRRYYNLRVGKEFNMSLKDFMELPYDHAQLILEMASSIMENPSPAQRQVSKQLELDLGGE